jgi:hypothetical protein
VARIRSELSEAEFAATVERGRRLPREEALKLGRAAVDAL